MAWLENESEFLYLEVEDIIAIYAEIFGCTDQEAMDQLRSRPGVEGALHRPQVYAHYQQAVLLSRRLPLPTASPRVSVSSRGTSVSPS